MWQWPLSVQLARLYAHIHFLVSVALCDVANGIASDT